MFDYSEILKNIQKKLGSQFLKDPTILNVPGKSVACKIDPFYYLAIHPLFFQKCALWAGILPTLIRDTLIKTGNIVILDPKTKEFVTELNIKWGSPVKSVKVNAFFLVADFLDQAIKIYARKNEILPVSELKIDIKEKSRLDVLFKGKTPINHIAFG